MAPLEDGGLSWASQPMNRSSIEKPGPSLYVPVLALPPQKRERETCSKILILVASADYCGTTNAQRQRQKRIEAVERPLKERIAKGGRLFISFLHIFSLSLSPSNILSREGKKGGKGRFIAIKFLHFCCYTIGYLQLAAARNISADLRSDFQIAKPMAGGAVLKPPKIEEKHPERKISVPRITIEDIRKHSPLMLSPRAPGDGSGKPLSGRMNCLCSPTTHAGSFRCRFHRNTFIPRGHSIGSNLSELAAKSGGISDSLQAQ